ncbi:hypothetical protein BDV95DRAFT_116231 [Massariosphaeria phaeospora]|uniref:Uncharacterized protein n=1 Tax=Massariosphaeria phaeospora TaxID=100035 RepID=A0A7C8I3R2_9PLEO|nr:hypothetical protein BDV95DRAFT_116231 [Massariosphaeria phaeospora]
MRRMSCSESGDRPKFQSRSAPTCPSPQPCRSSKRYKVPRLSSDTHCIQHALSPRIRIEPARQNPGPFVASPYI